MAVGRGIEPRLTDSESVVLPLNEPTKLVHGASDRTGDLRSTKPVRYQLRQPCVGVLCGCWPRCFGFTGRRVHWFTNNTMKTGVAPES